MPTYDYHCDTCETDFSAMHKIEEPAPICPNCGGPVKKKISAPAVHGAAERSVSAGTAAAAHGCGAGACGCRH